MYTGTGVLSQFVNLHVNTPRAAVLGPQELHVQEGDTITLICVIQQSKPPFVFWYHGENMVNYDGNRHRLNVITKVEGTRTHSRLTITDARRRHGGGDTQSGSHFRGGRQFLRRQVGRHSLPGLRFLLRSLPPRQMIAWLHDALLDIHIYTVYIYRRENNLC
ncbi:putative Immunoglobulin domain-containing protein 3 [Homarus americanus]|uniref:Putative Immunoglobulin domain-containing protein 3 n=1 Tax=Homarus americanus TaxID=6706 RepID=A0A8J5JHV1_HOMAM|nr:putative Immunoglobulin domain-containing protein 3 [Homarus americanus]